MRQRHFWAALWIAARILGWGRASSRCKFKQLRQVERKSNIVMSSFTFEDVCLCTYRCKNSAKCWQGARTGCEDLMADQSASVGIALRLYSRACMFAATSLTRECTCLYHVSAYCRLVSDLSITRFIVALHPFTLRDVCSSHHVSAAWIIRLCADIARNRVVFQKRRIVRQTIQNRSWQKLFGRRYKILYRSKPAP